MQKHNRKNGRAATEQLHRNVLQSCPQPSDRRPSEEVGRGQGINLEQARQAAQTKVKSVQKVLTQPYGAVAVTLGRAPRGEEPSARLFVR
jgi:hypothetical protein